MSSKEIIDAQNALQEKMDKIAEQNGLSSKTLSPIYDGVADVNAYLQSSPKIMWLLKEPYDYFNEETQEPEGGGWVLMEDMHREKEKTLNQTLPKTVQRVIYATAGIAMNKDYDNLAYYYQPEMYKYLFQIAYINLSKMPAGTRSEDMSEKYKIWRELLFEQINLYNPDVIIFGNTFSYMKNDFGVTDKDHFCQIIDWIDVYKKDHRLLIDAYHPGIICSTKRYVNTLIEAINKSFKR